VATAAICDAKIGGDLRGELHCPGSNGFVAHIDATMRKHFFDVSETERETELKPDRVLDHGRREAAPFVRNSRHWSLPEANEQRPSQRLVSVSLMGWTAPVSGVDAP